MKTYESYVIDTNVINYKVLYAIQNSFSENDLNPHSEQFKKAIYYAKLSFEWVNRLGFLPDCEKAKSVVWVGDSKPYWRAEVVPDYKSNRKVKPHFFSYLSQISQRFHPLTVYGYEADDVAALMQQVFYEDDRFHELNLVTVDTDWMGLCNDVHGNVVNWIDVGGYPPRVRNREETWYWIKSKFKKTSQFKLSPLDDFHASEIWDFKAMAGDPSDNLPWGTDVSLISLLEPPEKHKLWKRGTNRVAATQRLEHVTNDNKGVERLEHEMAKLGMEPPITVIEENSKISDKYEPVDALNVLGESVN